MAHLSYFFMLLISFDSKLLVDFINILHSEFAMKGLGLVHHFLGTEVQ